MSKHTPGPWEANGVIVTAGRESFRALFDCKPISMTLSAEECEANAQLIAAAPELLEACIKAHDALLALHVCDKDRGWCGDIRETLKQAIAKAEVQNAV